MSTPPTSNRGDVSDVVHQKLVVPACVIEHALPNDVQRFPHRSTQVSVRTLITVDPLMPCSQYEPAHNAGLQARERAETRAFLWRDKPQVATGSSSAELIDLTLSESEEEAWVNSDSGEQSEVEVIG